MRGVFYIFLNEIWRHMRFYFIMVLATLFLLGLSSRFVTFIYMALYSL